MLRWGRIAAAYAVLCGVALALTWPRGSPLRYPYSHGELGRGLLGGGSAHLLSLGLGIAFGFALVVASRVTVQRYAWALRLHLELRPFASSLTPTGVVVLALLSSAGEELFFRSLLQPWMGLLPQALLFGLVHQLPGRSRWVWATWAFFVGLALGALFEATGSLLGPLAAHALVNGVNLSFLKSHDPDPDELPRLEVGV
ncbi:MAG TPA: type II CAAX endopeptidase family protein [Polyangiaceae bacterium]|nr:type II CAAX endopeptidase family protein [Polyangiaceae bacterium]